MDRKKRKAFSKREDYVKDPLKELGKLLDEAGMTLTFQPLRDYTNMEKMVEYSKLLEDALCWHSGKNLDAAIVVYQKHKKEFPELHK